VVVVSGVVVVVVSGTVVVVVSGTVVVVSGSVVVVGSVSWARAGTLVMAATLTHAAARAATNTLTDRDRRPLPLVSLVCHFVTPAPALTSEATSLSGERRGVRPEPALAANPLRGQR
jgi:hypothetical protein